MNNWDTIIFAVDKHRFISVGYKVHQQYNVQIKQFSNSILGESYLI